VEWFHGGILLVKTKSRCESENEIERVVRSSRHSYNNIRAIKI
jgi:hypothetical protein